MAFVLMQLIASLLQIRVATESASLRERAPSRRLPAAARPDLEMVVAQTHSFIPRVLLQRMLQATLLLLMEITIEYASSRLRETSRRSPAAPRIHTRTASARPRRSWYRTASQ
jgi:hypothetical protein